jgi:hypothetical protein
MHVSSLVWVRCANSIVELAASLADQTLQAHPVHEAARDDRVAFATRSAVFRDELVGSLTKTA